jgi:hypothetical protein
MNFRGNHWQCCHIFLPVTPISNNYMDSVEKWNAAVMQAQGS